jgi:hypothetical protein
MHESRLRSAAQSSRNIGRRTGEIEEQREISARNRLHCFGSASQPCSSTKAAPLSSSFGAMWPHERGLYRRRRVPHPANPGKSRLPEPRKQIRARYGLPTGGKRIRTIGPSRAGLRFFQTMFTPCSRSGARYRSKWHIDDSDGALLFGLGVHGQYCSSTPKSWWSPRGVVPRTVHSTLRA